METTSSGSFACSSSGSPQYLRKRIPSARAPCAQYCMRPSSRAPPRIWAPFRWLPHVWPGAMLLKEGGCMTAACHWVFPR
jgi:hypothetical protein